MPQSLSQNFHDVPRKVGGLLHKKMEAPLINFGQATRLRWDNRRSAGTGIDQGHFAEQRSRSRTLYQRFTDAHIGCALE